MANSLRQKTVAGGSHQCGLSLIELMIASALGLVIVAGLTQLLLNVARANRDMAQSNLLVERARFAMHQLREDVVHAGFWGSYIPRFDDLMSVGVPGDEPTLLPDPCLAVSAWGHNTNPGYVRSLLGMPVQVYANSPGASCAALLLGESADQGTDVLVVRRAGTCVSGRDNCNADSSGPLYFQASNCALELQNGRYFSLGSGPFPLTERDCSTPAAKRRFVQNIYFVRDNSRGIPALYRSEFGFSSGEARHLAAQELAPGIERFLVELGIDNRSETGGIVDYGASVAWQNPRVRVAASNRGDGVPDGEFIRCTSSAPCTVEQFTNATSVRIHLLVRAQQPSPGYTDSKIYRLGDLGLGPFNDHYRRHVFSSTIRLNNPAGRRETP